MLHLYYLESLNQDGKLSNCEISLNMIGIQDEHNKNFHIEFIEYHEKFDT